MLTLGLVTFVAQPKFLEQTLSSITRDRIYRAGQLRVIIVNNNRSLQQQVEEFAKNNRNVSIIQNVIAKGYAESCNQILSETDTPYVAFIHSDVILTSRTLANALSHLLINPQIYCIVPRTNYANENEACIPSLRSAFEKIKQPNKTILTSSQIEQILQVLYPNGLEAYAQTLTSATFTKTNQATSYCNVFNTQKLKQLRGFDPRFHKRGYEEKELHRRASNQQLIFAYAENAYVHHHGNLSTDGVDNCFPDLLREHELIYQDIKTRPITHPPVSDTLYDKPPVPSTLSTALSVTSSTNKIVHITNLTAFTVPRLREAQDLSIESILQNYSKNSDRVLLVNAASTPIVHDKFTQVTLSRDARAIDPKGKDFPFLKDLLDLAATRADQNDWLLYCNSDCILGPDFYEHLLDQSAECIQYHRLDCDANCTSLGEVYRSPNAVYFIGIDGIALRKAFYLKIREHFPDFLIGCPAWDPCFNNLSLLQTHVVQNYIDLYHRSHPRTWSIDTPDPSGAHNLRLAKELERQIGTPINYKLFNPEHIDTAIIAFASEEDDGIIIRLFQSLYEKQRVNARYYLITHTNNPSAYEELLVLPNVIPILLSKENRHSLVDQTLFYCNTGAKASKEENLIFIDLNCFSQQQSYFASLRYQILKHPEKFVLGYNYCNVDGKSCQNWLIKSKKPMQERVEAATNFVLGCSRTLWKHVGGFSQNVPFVDPLLLCLSEFSANKEIFETLAVLKREVLKRKQISFIYLEMEISAHTNQQTSRQKLNFLGQALAEDPLEKTPDQWNSLDNSLLSHLTQTFLRDRIIAPLTRDAWDFAVIIPTYGIARQHLVYKTIAALQRQYLKAYIVLVELLFDGEETCFNFVEPNIIHRIVRGSEQNKNVCQKEALLNLGVEYVPQHVKYLFFLDNDVYSADVQWLNKVRQKLIDGNGGSKATVVQGFLSIMDEKDSAYHFISFSANRIRQLETTAVNPGVAWAMTRDYFNAIGGLNPFFVQYGGDLGFCAEAFNTDLVKHEAYIPSLPRFNDLLRSIEKAKMDFVDTRLIHLHHGPLEARAYGLRFRIVNGWKQSIQETVYLDQTKLVAWRPNMEVEQQSLKVPVSNLNEAIVWFEQQNYPHQLTPVTSTNNPSKSTPPCEDPFKGIKLIRSHTLTNDPFTWSKNCFSHDPGRGRLPAKDGALLITAIDVHRSAEGTIVFSDSWEPTTVLFPESKKLIIKTTCEHPITILWSFEAKEKDRIIKSKAVPTLLAAEQSVNEIPLSAFIDQDFNFLNVFKLCFYIEKTTPSLISISALDIK